MGSGLPSTTDDLLAAPQVQATEVVVGFRRDDGCDLRAGDLARIQIRLVLMDEVAVLQQASLGLEAGAQLAE